MTVQKRPVLLKTTSVKSVKMDKISKPSQNMKVRQKERCLHKTIYSWLKHICLKAKQSYETEIRGLN